MVRDLQVAVEYAINVNMAIEYLGPTFSCSSIAAVDYGIVSCHLFFGAELILTDEHNCSIIPLENASYAVCHRNFNCLPEPNAIIYLKTLFFACDYLLRNCIKTSHITSNFS